MPFELSPGPEPSEAQLNEARQAAADIDAYLKQIRDDAVIWRNGLGAIIAALIGFSLIKGRTDIGQLQSIWAGAVGVLLVTALAVGAFAAFSLLSACGSVPLRAHKVQNVSNDGQLAEWWATIRNQKFADAARSRVSLRRGISAAFLSMAVLVIAVGITWYGPERAGPKLLIRDENVAYCGSAVRTNNDSIDLKTSKGQVAIKLSDIRGIEAVDKCPAA